MMGKRFDDALRAAFDAGRERGRDERASEEEFVHEHMMAPTFEEWRPTLGDPE